MWVCGLGGDLHKLYPEVILVCSCWSFLFVMNFVAVLFMHVVCHTYEIVFVVIEFNDVGVQS